MDDLVFHSNLNQKDSCNSVWIAQVGAEVFYYCSCKDRRIFTVAMPSVSVVYILPKLTDPSSP